MRQKIGAGLIGLGLLLAVLVIPLWSAETREAEKDQLAQEFAEAISSQPFEDVEPNRAPAIALGAVGAVLVLAGVVLVASPSPDS